MNEKSKAPNGRPIGQTLAAIWGPLALTDDELAHIRRSSGPKARSQAEAGRAKNTKP